jgi:rhamnogalacturonyl hydrolase YesR
MRVTEKQKRSRSERKAERKTQREIVREVLLCAAGHEQWMTLGELSRKTRYPEASISAQLRHLRKAANGGYVVKKRRRAVEEAARESKHELVWEYQMRYGVWMEAQHVVAPEKVALV